MPLLMHGQKESVVKKSAGWYPDEADSSRVRYWNGKLWTDIYADSASGAVIENDLFDAFAENIGKAIRGAGVTPGMVAVSVKEMLLKANKLDSPKFICMAGKSGKGKYILVYSKEIVLLEVGFKAPKLQTFSLAGIDSFEYAYSKMFLRYPNLRREEFSPVIYEDFQIICEQTTIDSFAESALGSYIGKVSPEGYLERSSRQDKVFASAKGSTIEIWSKRIRCGNQEYVIDEFVEAQVYQDGDIQITQRPTLTRMAAGSILPGTALIPGLAFQKKKKNDLRETVFTVSGIDWSLSVEISPNQLTTARSIATQINQAAKKISKTTPLIATEVSAPTAGSKVDQLTKLESLRASGAISEDEFALLKSQILQ
jgi:hypothetical protein